MKPEEVTFEKLPAAIAYLIKEVSLIRKLLEEKYQPQSNKKELIDIDRACQILKKAKPTVYTLSRKRIIPSYKFGKRLYFYEEELIMWIEKTRRKTSIELMDEVNNKMNRGIGRRRNG